MTLPLFRKSLADLTDAKTKNDRTKEDFNSFLNFCKRNKIEVYQGVGFILHRSYYLSDKKLAGVGEQLFKGNKDISVAHRVSLR